MPLYKNDEGPIRLNDAEIKSIENHFHGKFPVKIVYPPERVVKSKLPHNRLPDKPNSLSFDYRAVVKTAKGTEVWRYVENIITDQKGHKRYIPKKFSFDGTLFLDRNDIEKIFFLLRKSEYCMGGDNQGPMVKFMFEDLVTAAEKKAEKKRIEVKVDHLLYDEESSLDEAKLRAIAGAYNLVGVENYSVSQVKNFLRDQIFTTKEGPDEFFLMIGDDAQIKARNSITTAMKMGVLIYDDKKTAWQWKGPDGITTLVCKVHPTKSPNVAIYDHYLGSNAFQEDLQAVLLTKNPKAGKKKEEVVEE